MKQLYFLLFALLSQFSFSAEVAPPIANSIGPQQICDVNANPLDGFCNFDLSSYVPLILVGNPQSNSNYNVTFYTNVGLTNQISNPTNYTNTVNPQIIYVKVTHIASGEFSVTNFELVVIPQITPTFAQLAPICQGSTPPLLPTTSTNATPITGTWSPAVINTSFPGLMTCTFTPNPGQCAIHTTMTIVVEAAPTITTPPVFATCDDEPNDNDGYYLFSLNALISGILGSQSTSSHAVSFFETQASAQANTNPIANTANYQTYTHAIWIRVTNTVTGCFSVGSFNTIVEQYPTPTITTNNNSNVICVDYVTNNVSQPLILTANNSTNYLIGNPPPTYAYQWYADGVPIPGSQSPFLTISSPLPGANVVNYGVVMESLGVMGCSSGSQDFTVHQSGQASPIGIGYSIVNNADVHTLTVEVQGYGAYEYAIDNGARQASPVFSNVPLGFHSIEVFDIEGGALSCAPLLLTSVEVRTAATPPPTGNATQSFASGATLANVQVNGQYLRWYAGSNPAVFNTPLPQTTLLVDGTTYYASQKIGGYESVSRLPVLIQINLGDGEFASENIQFYPNPVRNTLYVKHNETVKNIAVYTALGQMVLSKAANSQNIELDVTDLQSGIYFVTIETASNQNTIRVIKE